MNSKISRTQIDLFMASGTDGDCFCEDFKKEEEAIRYLNNEDFNLMENGNANTQV